MTFNYEAYAITEFFLIIYAGTILLRLNSNIGSEHEVKELRYMLLAYIVTMAFDIMWAHIEDDIWKPPVFINMLVNAVAILAITAGCYFWLRFIEDKVFKTNFKAKRLIDILITIPIVIAFIGDVITIFTGWWFFIDDSGHYEIHNSYYIQIVINYLYLIVPTIAAICKAIIVKSKSEKSEFVLYAVYMIVPVAATSFEDVIQTTPILGLGMLMIVQIIFLMIQSRQINNDALTELNNRRRLNQYLNDCLEKASTEHPVTVLMIDINGFKNVNDRFGHLEGDHALKTVASALKQAGSKYGVFVGRFGGDEFCVISNNATYTPEEITRGISQTLDKDWNSTNEAKEKYQLSVSIGFAVTTDAIVDSNRIIETADDMLYINKSNWHKENDSL